MCKHTEAGGRRGKSDVLRAIRLMQREAALHYFITFYLEVRFVSPAL